MRSRWCCNNCTCYLAGCQMNASDSEVIASVLAQQQYTKAPSPAEAGVVLLNTCAIRWVCPALELGWCTGWCFHLSQQLKHDVSLHAHVNARLVGASANGQKVPVNTDSPLHPETSTWHCKALESSRDVVCWQCRECSVKQVCLQLLPFADCQGCHVMGAELSSWPVNTGDHRRPCHKRRSTCELCN